MKIERILIGALAPKAPPCFATRDSWLSYLEGASAVGRSDQPTPFVMSEEGKLEFNREFAFCADCTAQHSFHMERAKKCYPTFIIDLIRPSTPTRPAELMPA